MPPVLAHQVPPPTPYIATVDGFPNLKRIYDKTKRHNEQAVFKPPIPPAFLDAMKVRETVYVDEQGIALENEFDADDPRAVHFVIYASPPRSSTESVPIGTIRLVPFPHPPHPRRGGAYVGDQLTNADAPVAGIDPSGEGIVTPLSWHQVGRIDDPGVWPPMRDRPTDFHDGKEAYLKLGRLAVLKEYRGRGIAGELVRFAIEYAQSQPDIFDVKASQVGFEHVEFTPGGGQMLPAWNGLFCCHAQESAVKVWEKAGFRVDKAMGKWTEEGIPHVGMFKVVKLEKKGAFADTFWEVR